MIIKLQNGISSILLIIFLFVDLFTFIFLTFFDGYIYNWWNWIIAIPCNAFLSTIWPIYWGILRWIFN